MRDTNKTKIMRYIFAYFSAFLSIPLFILSLIGNDTQLASISVLLAWAFLMLINYSRERVMLFAFSLTFFAFLLGEVFVNLFDETRLYSLHTESLMHTFVCLFISIWSIHLGSKIGLRYKISFGGTGLSTKTWGEYDTNYIRSACKVLFFVFATCSLAIAIERFFMVRVLGSYTATFIDYHSSLPSFISKLAGMTDMVFFLYLATLPDPKKSKMVFGYKLLISTVILLYGTRNTIVLTILIIALYCIFYEDAHNIRYSIISKRIYLFVVIALPAVFVFFDFIMSIRDGRAYSFDGIFTSLKNIVSSLGGSVNVITYGYEYHDALGDKLYSIGNIKDFFTQNIFARVLFGAKQYGGNTVEKALYGNSFSNTLTYLVRRSSYLAGYGMGSCYIAELFHDFGYIGVVFINIIYGGILSQFTKLKAGNIIGNTVVLMATYNILLAPRGYADGFISCFINFSFLITLLLVFAVKQVIKPRRYKQIK